MYNGAGSRMGHGGEYVQLTWAALWSILLYAAK
jgi:hypothetical protein